MLPHMRPVAVRISRTLLLLCVFTSPMHAQPAAQRPATEQKSTSPASSSEPSISAALRHKADQLGLWGSLGIGRASAGLRCGTCTNESTRAYVLDGTLGIRITPRLLMGVETYGWLDVFGGGVDRISRGTYLIARLYPNTDGNLFFNAGAGVAGFRIYDNEIGFNTRSPSMSLAAGYDWHLSRVTVTPSIAAVASTGGTLRSSRTSNAVDENARLTLFRTSVSFSWFR